MRFGDIVTCARAPMSTTTGSSASSVTIAMVSSSRVASLSRARVRGRLVARGFHRRRRRGRLPRLARARWRSRETTATRIARRLVATSSHRDRDRDETPCARANVMIREVWRFCYSARKSKTKPRERDASTSTSRGEDIIRRDIDRFTVVEASDRSARRPCHRPEGPCEEASPPFRSPRARSAPAAPTFAPR